MNQTGLLVEKNKVLLEKNKVLLEKDNKLAQQIIEASNQKKKIKELEFVIGN